MARKAAVKKAAKSFEQALWETAIGLRGSVEPSEYKHVVLSLIFLKFASDKFEEREQEIIDEGREKFLDRVEFYAMKNVFYLPEEARWLYIQQNAKQDDLALKIDTALHTLEKNNESLTGALPDNYFSRLDLDRSKLAALIDTISNINTLADKAQDVVGRVYEYFLSKFSMANVNAAEKKGEFYTPKSIVNLIAELIEPYQGKIYDPCCGSGGMFVQSVKFVESHQGSAKNVSIYGQEGITATLKLARMNLAIRGISANLGSRGADTFSRDQHPNLKADFIMANPPFNLKKWRADDELVDDPRWAGYEVPPPGNANYGWILHMVSKLSVNGVAGFILANGALSGDEQEKAIRKKLIENRLVEAIILLPRNMFYTTDISVTLWVINRNRTARIVEHGERSRHYREREDEILFMDLRQRGEPFEKKYIQFSDAERAQIAETFHTWQEERAAEDYADVSEYCYSASIDEVRAKDYSLVPSKYIEFVNRDENIDFDAKMLALRGEFADLLQAETKSKAELLEVFKGLGYAIDV